MSPALLYVTLLVSSHLLTGSVTLALTLFDLWQNINTSHTYTQHSTPHTYTHPPALTPSPTSMRNFFSSFLLQPLINHHHPFTQEVANQAAKAGCDARAALTRYSSRDGPQTDSDTMGEAERATALKFVRLMQVRDNHKDHSRIKYTLGASFTVSL